MADTAIEWADAVWNPTTGCDRISPGCDNCYALTMAKRLKGMGSPKYQTDGDPRTSGPGFGVTTHPDALSIPLGWKKPKRIFVNSMSDLFHARVPREFVARVFAVMAATPQHTYQVLTKRPERSARMLATEHFQSDAHSRLIDLEQSMTWSPEFRWPLPNVWFGTSVEDQARAAQRIDHLYATPAAVRWLSLEPLLGPVDLSPWLSRGHCRRHRYLAWEAHPDRHPLCADCGQPWSGQGIDWCVVGGESGPGARPMHPDWARSLRDQCAAELVPFFFKQWGEWAPHNVARPTYSQLVVHGAHWDGTDAATARVGKSAAGRMLDGRTHDDYPAARSAEAVQHG